MNVAGEYEKMKPLKEGLLVFCFLLFSACSTVRHEARPPSSYGVASWYGREFQGRPTSSGEIFDMYKKTCAHREYAFGTRMRVTNPANGKSVECVVNDRGPFVAGRDIDLSFAAAREIELIGSGTSRVFFEVTGRDVSYIRSVEVRADARSGPFTIQVGSFTDAQNAVRMKAALDLKYRDVSVQEADVRGTIYYRVRVGIFGSLTEASTYAKQLGQEGYTPFVIKANTGI